MITRVNIHHLELFYHVVKHRGISAASRRMPYGIQQPAISGQLSQLEKSLGVRLVERRPFRTCNLVELPLVLVVPRRSKIHAISDLFRSGQAVLKLISLPSNEVLSKNFHTGLKTLGLHWPTAIEVVSLDLIDIYTSLGFG